MLRSSVALALLALLGCGAPEAVDPSPTIPPEPTVTAEHAEAGLTTPCAALPDAFSQSLRVRLTQHDYDRPEAMARWDVVASDATCPADELPAHLGYARPACVRIPAAELEALYAALQREGLARLRARPATSGPHRGGHRIEVAWAGGECSVSSVSGDHTVTPDDAPAFRTAIDRIADVVRAAQ